MQRRYREPSERNRQIWRAVRIERRGQEEIARDYGITQSRVSKIVRRMSAWYAEHSPEVLELSELAAQRRVADIEHREHVELCLTKAAAAIERSQQPLVTKKERRTKTIEGDVVVREVIVEETTTRQQPLSTRALTLYGKFARERWELAGGEVGSACRAEPGALRDAGPPSQGSSRQEEPTKQEEAVDEELKWHERRVELGRQSAISRLESVRGGSLTLEEAEYWSYRDAISTDWIYPSYYEKNADGMTFKVADWVRDHVPAERLHGPEYQPVWTCHDIADWDAWSSGGEAVWGPVRAACLARWEAWRASVGASARHGNPNHVNCEFWARPAGFGGRANSAEPAASGKREPPDRSAATAMESHREANASRSPESASAAMASHREANASRSPDAGAEPERPLDVTSPRKGSSRQEEPTLPRQPTYIERLLASDRRLPPRRRRRLEGLAARRRG